MVIADGDKYGQQLGIKELVDQTSSNKDQSASESECSEQSRSNMVAHGYDSSPASHADASFSEEGDELIKKLRNKIKNLEDQRKSSHCLKSQREKHLNGKLNQSDTNGMMENILKYVDERMASLAGGKKFQKWNSKQPQFDEMEESADLNEFLKLTEARHQSVIRDSNAPNAELIGQVMDLFKTQTHMHQKAKEFALRALTVDPAPSWSEFKTYMLSSDEEFTLLQQIAAYSKLKDEGSHASYVLELDKYVQKFNDEPAKALDTMFLYRYLEGLKPSCRTYVQDQNPESYDEATKFGRAYAKRILLKNSSESGNKDDRGSKRNNGKKRDRDRDRAHQPDDQFKRSRNEKEFFGKITCKRCGSFKHATSNCYSGDRIVNNFIDKCKKLKYTIPEETKLAKAAKSTVSNYFCALSDTTQMQYIRNRVNTYSNIVDRNESLTFLRTAVKSCSESSVQHGEAFVDCGASFDAVSVEYARKCGWAVTKYPSRPLKLTVGGGKDVMVDRQVAIMELDVMDVGRYKAHCYVLENLPDGADVLLGMPFLHQVNPSINWADKTMSVEHRVSNALNYHMHVPHNGKKGLTKVINLTQFQRMMRIEKSEGFMFSIQLKHKSKVDRQSQQGWEKLKDHPLYEILIQYQDTVFAEEAVNAQHGMEQHTIELNSAKPISSRNYRLSPEQLKAVEEWAQEMLCAGLIQPSTSPYSSPILVVKKPVGFRIVHDYRAINAVTNVPQSIIPRREDIIDAMSGSHWFTAMDLRSGYYQIPLREQDRPITAFSLPSGHYEYTVMAQGLSGAPSTFNKVMQRIFDGTSDTARAFFDDIFVFTKSDRVEEHGVALKEALEKLKNNNLRVKLEKCVFLADEIPVLGDLVGRNGVRMDPDKVSIIQHWPIPRTRHELKSFLGTVVYNSRFIKDYGKLVAPLHQATVGKLKNSPIMLSDKQIEAFNKLKSAMINPPVLSIANSALPFGIRTDASDYAVGGTLFNILPNGEERVIAYYGRKLSKSEINYGVREKEFLGILHALRAWRPYLLDKPFVCETDHKSLEQLLTQPKCTRRMARWLDELAEYPITFKWIAGDTNTTADGLSRHPEFAQDSPGAHQSMIEFLRQLLEDPLCFNAFVEKAQHSLYSHNVRTRPQESLDIANLCRELYETDPYLSDILAQLEGGVAAEQNSSRRTKAKGRTMNVLPFTLDETGLLWFTGSKGVQRLCVPTSNKDLLNRIMYDHHDVVTAGHPGLEKTKYALKNQFFWKNMDRDIAFYIKTCQSCQRNKTLQRRPPGLLNPLQIPEERWRSISMDYLVALPQDKYEYDAIWVIVCRLSKRILLIAAKSRDTAEDSAKRFFQEYLRFHDMPEDIVSDRDSTFTSRFWTELMRLHGTELNLSSAFRPNTDGQTEICNKFIEDYLRAYIAGHQNVWTEHIATMERAFNTRVHSVHGKTPYEVDTGRPPRTIPVVAINQASGSDRKLEQALKFKQKLDADLLDAQESLAMAQLKMQKYYNRNRKAQLFRVGEKVLLSTKNLSLPHLLLRKDGAKRKLAPKYIGPFAIAKLARNPDTYRLKMQASLKLHPEFHTSLLKPWYIDPNPNRRSEVPPLMDENGEPLYLVEKIVGDRVRGRKRQYLIRWLGYDQSEDTWEDANSLGSIVGLIDDYKANKSK